MNWYIFLLLCGLAEQCLSFGLSSGTAKENAMLMKLIGKHFYPELIQKVKNTYEFGLDYEGDSKNGSLTSQYSWAQSQESENCSQKLSKFWNSLDYGKRQTYFDSFGKIGAGVLTGNIVYLGYYDQCIDIGNTEFCRFPFSVAMTQNPAPNGSIPFVLPVQFGMCFPSSCSAKGFYQTFFQSKNGVIYTTSYTDKASATTYTIIVRPPLPPRFSPFPVNPQCPWRDLDWTTSSVIVLVVCCVLAGLVLAATLLDLLLWVKGDVLPSRHPEVEEPPATIGSAEVKHSINEDEPFISAEHKSKTKGIGENRYIEFLKDLMLSFSLYKTIPVIMSTHQPAHAISCINGIRVISIFWVILGHTYFWALITGVVENLFEAIQTVPDRFLFQPIDNTYFAVDSFLMLSGLLMCYLGMRDMERRQGKFPYVFFYLHRLLRLSPSYYFIVFFSFKILPYIGSGPLWYFTDVHYCEKYWWTDLLYINNFYPNDLAKTCYVIGWYVAINMQFFIISPIFLLLLYYVWGIGFLTIIGTMLVSIATIGTLAGIQNPDANLVQGILTNTASFAFSNIYKKPYCRINAFLVGVILGYVLYKKWRVWHDNFWIRTFFYGALWVIAATLSLIVVFGEYWTWHGHKFVKTENVLYFMFSRTTYSIGIAIMVYVCHNGFGGFINTFLSWRLWVPLGRLTFNAFLSHPTALTIIYSTMRFRFFETDVFLVALVAAAIVLSFSMALIIAVLIEFPIANIENAVYKFFGVKRRK